MKPSIKALIVLALLAITLNACGSTKQSNTALEPSPIATATPSNPAPIKTFETVFKEKLDAKKAEGAPTQYAEEAFEAWSKPLGGSTNQFEAAKNAACEDLKTFSSVDEISEVAHRVNGYTTPLEQYQTYNEIKFAAAKEIGCN